MNTDINSEERLALARKGVEPYASRYGYTATKTQAKKRKKIKRTTTVLKVIGLLALMGGGMTIIFEQIQHNLFLAQIPGADPLLFVLFIALIPLTYIKILQVTNLDKAHWTKEVLEKLEKAGIYANSHPFNDDNDYPSVNVDGTPMTIGRVDINGNPYGSA